MFLKSHNTYPFNTMILDGRPVYACEQYAVSSDKDIEEGSAFRSLSHFSGKVSSAFVIQISFSRVRVTFFPLI